MARALKIEYEGAFYHVTSLIKVRYIAGWRKIE